MIYEEYCVAFIDILGFKNMSSKENIEKYSVIINGAIKDMREMKVKKNLTGSDSNIPDSIKTIQFADSIVILFPKTPYVCLLAIRKIMALQFKLSLKGVFVRGAINSGGMYIDKENDIYYGEAWNKAVMQESEAIHPRILLENSLAHLISEWLLKINESTGEFYIDQDGYYVLQSYGGTAAFDLEINYKDSLKQILQIIEKSISENNLDDKILRKYLFLVKSIKYSSSGNISEADYVYTNIIEKLIGRDFNDEATKRIRKNI
ncbi:hypothetical protein [Anaerovorax odorimutans]|uniref:hypothetical protein n=1 Tax=Anaerovorax odorimutans TaxID=109327 RepID=UPI0003FBC89F|nr:hypothetical protein [Anaerovorax odorimutans]